MLPSLQTQAHVYVKQRHEIAEWIGFETRNKYEFYDQNMQVLAFAAEQRRGFLGAIVRQIFGHWRTFDLHFFTADRQPLMRAHHPFRWYYQRLEVTDAQGQKLGDMQRRFAIFSKKFALSDDLGQSLIEMESPFWRIWTFPLKKRGTQVACIKKKWSGLLAEAMTDKDNFQIDFEDPKLSVKERHLILAAALFIDLLYFEKKAGDKSSFLSDIFS